MTATEKGLLFNSTRKYPSFEMLNIKCLIVGAGNDIQTKVPPGDLEDGMVISVTADSTDLALRKGVLYVRTLGQWISINAGTHTHLDSNDGGPLPQAFVKGGYQLYFANYANPERFNQITSAVNGTATMNASGFLQLSTGSAVANNVINCYDRGLLYTFTKPLSFFSRIKMTSVTTSYLSRFGFNGDPAETVSPAVTKPQVIIEACDTCNTNKISIVTGNGTDRIKDTSDNVGLASDVANYLMENIPTQNKALYLRNNTTFVIKDETIPSSGQPNRLHLMIAGIQSKNTTQKTMDIYGFTGNAYIGEDNWNSLIGRSF